MGPPLAVLGVPGVPELVGHFVEVPVGNPPHELMHLNSALNLPPSRRIFFSYHKSDLFPLLADYTEAKDPISIVITGVRTAQTGHIIVVTLHDDVADFGTLRTFLAPDLMVTTLVA
jgi:hypothetical protein